jgi:hypothetical protein
VTNCEALELVQEILAMKVESATAQVNAKPSDFSNGYRAGVIDCLGLVNELVQGSKKAI